MSLFIHVVIPSNRSLGNSSTVESKIGALGILCGFDNLRGVDVMLCFEMLIDKFANIKTDFILNEVKLVDSCITVLHNTYSIIS